MIMSNARFLTRTGIPLFAGMLTLAISLESAGAQQSSVLTYHGDASRSGNFVVPVLTWEKARSVHLDPSFEARVAGHLYAQPLYWHASGSNTATLLVATEDDAVQAFDATTGKELGDGRSGVRLRVRCCLAAISIHLASPGRRSSTPQPKRSILTRPWSGQTDLATKFLGYR